MKDYVLYRIGGNNRPTSLMVDQKTILRTREEIEEYLAREFYGSYDEYFKPLMDDVFEELDRGKVVHIPLLFSYMELRKVRRIIKDTTPEILVF